MSWNDQEIKAFPEKENLRETICTRPVLQKMLKEVLQTERADFNG
jgi:hypothetical protein